MIELKHYLYTKPSQNVLTLRRQGSGAFLINSPAALQRNTEMRRSGRNGPLPKNELEDALKYTYYLNYYKYNFQMHNNINNVNNYF